MKANINVTTTAVLSRKVESHRENKGQRRRKQNCRRGRVQQCWVGLAPVWTEIAGKLQSDMLYFYFLSWFLILVWLLKWNSFLTPPPPWFFVTTRISSWVVFEDTVSTLSILLFFGKGCMPHCLSSFFLIPLSFIFSPTWIKNLTGFWQWLEGAVGNGEGKQRGQNWILPVAQMFLFVKLQPW